MSPMPRMRLAMASGLNVSKPSSFSPVPMNLIGLPVTWRTESAAPPRESPSTFVRMMPVSGSRSLKTFAVLIASWPTIASTTKNVSIGFRKADRSDASCIMRSSIERRPAVSTISTSKK